MKRLLSALGLAALLATTLPGTPAHAAAPVTTIKPAELPRGADVAGPHLVGKVIVDGDRRVRAPGRAPWLHGASGDGYIVSARSAGRWHLYRVGDGATKVLHTGGYPEYAVLSDDGAKVALTLSQTSRRTVVKVISATTGAKIRRKAWAKAPRVLDIDGNRAVVGGPDGGYLWNLRTGRSRVIDTGFVYEADLGANRLASFDKDPYDGGCSSVSTLLGPEELFTIDCTEAVRAFSDDGARMITVHKLSDGIGPNLVRERTVEGKRLATYKVGFFFGEIRWETDTAVLLDAYGKRKGATVRCTEGTCERASSLRATPAA
ncbi:hypothetical protein [Nocardioides sp. GXZ039]|uniref:hypothetical protein n=1 Tax=Nocardioides sp. GXZ039 TaxID=3136018 RepID=UPI0030F4970C